MNTLIPVVVQTLLPELIQWIRGWHAASGQMPTDADVMAKFIVDYDRITNEASAWLASHPEGSKREILRMKS